MCVWLHMHPYHTAHVWRSKGRSHDSPATMWDPGIEFRWSGLATGTVTR